MGAGKLRQNREVGISGLDFCALQASRSQTLAEPTPWPPVENLKTWRGLGNGARTKFGTGTCARPTRRG
jgi:hypothetical protein